MTCRGYFTLCTCLLSFVFIAEASVSLPALKAEAQDLQPWLVQMRRQLHEIPELGFELHKTTKAVKDVLGDLQISYKYPVGRSAIVADIGSGGPIVALRADMDALPISEPEGLPFKSKHEGRMHACGHDAHTTMLLGAAKLLKKHESSLQGTVRLVFQAAEELGTGAADLVRAGGLDGVTAAFGFHVMPSEPTGVITGRPGVFLAGASQFSITVTGRGGHAALPWLNVDPVLAVAHMITAFQGLISRETNPLEAASIISVSKLEAGTVHNVIPDTATFHGTIRSLSKEHMKYLVKRVTAVVEGVASSFACTAAIDWREEDMAPVPPTFNDAGAFEFAKEVVGDLFQKPVVDVPPLMATEDFAYYGETAPATMLFLGIRNETVGSTYNLHNPNFRVDEDVLPTGAALHAALAIEYLAKNAPAKDEL